MIFRAISAIRLYLCFFKKKKTKDIAAIGAKTNRFHNTYPIKMKNIAIIMGGYSSEYKIHLSAETSSINFWTKQNTTDSASIF
jgi:hypothetical protein